ncbi:MAG: HIT family protein [Rhodobiaceae bacterium]|nr:HIT family protein [Rhodobiaceae bacterium]
MFKLDKRLEQDTIFIKNLNLSKLLLMNNSNFPWLILVPMRENLIELIDLSKTDQQQLLSEISSLSRFLKKTDPKGKLNIGTLGNIVNQLHIHIVIRNKNDLAWPNSIWGFDNHSPYSKEQSLKLLEEISNFLNEEDNIPNE